MALRKKTYVDFRQHQPICNTAAVGQIAVSTDNTANFVHAGAVTFEIRNEQANADIIPTLLVDSNCTNGWQIPNDNADNDGIEMGLGILDDVNMPNVFKIGTSGAFRLDVKFGIPDVSDYDVCVIGFRKVAAYGDAINAPAAFSSAVVYTDAAGFNVNAGDIYTFGGVNQTGGGTGTYTSTDTTDNWADDAVKTLSVLVSSAGVVTYQIDGASPTVDTTTCTFDSGDNIIPFMVFTKGAAAADTPPILTTFYCGLQ